MAQASEGQRAEALLFLDEAVRARYEERWQDAADAVAAARRADPQVRGLDVLIGEIALEQRDARTLRAATEAALRKGEQQSSVNLLRAVETWMKRGEQGVDQAGARARQYLSEAAENEPSAAAVYFFDGELSRLLGKGPEARQQLRAALYRQSPWRSSAVLETKMNIAVVEAREAGKAVPTAGVPSAQGEAVLGLRQTVRSGKGTDAALAEVLSVTSALQAMVVLRDASMGQGLAQRGAAEWREGLEDSIPYLRSVGRVAR